MFEIKYSFSNNNQLNAIYLDEETLRYNVFLGNLILKKDSESIVIDWGWIPLLDFAICLLTIYNNISEKKEGYEEFEFTESDEKIFFERNHNILKITTTFSENTLKIDFEDFKNAFKKFYKGIFHDVLLQNRQLLENKAFLTHFVKSENW